MLVASFDKETDAKSTELIERNEDNDLTAMEEVIEHIEN